MLCSVLNNILIKKMYVKIRIIFIIQILNFIASILKVLKIPGVMLAAASIIVTSMSIGFLSATLEPHLRQVRIY